MSAASANARDFDFFAAGAATPQEALSGPGDYLLWERMSGLLAGGGTLHLSNLQKYSSLVNQICRLLTERLRQYVEADLWITKHNNFDPYLHFDRHDIVVVQILGGKRWQAFPSRPFPREGAATVSPDEVGAPVLAFDIAPGDMIFLPAGTPHIVTTIDPISIHVGFGLHGLTQFDFLQSLLETWKSVPGVLQEPLKPGTDRPRLKAELIQSLCGALDATDVEGALDCLVLHSDRSSLYKTGEIAVEDFIVAPLTPDCWIQRRDEGTARLTEANGILRLTFGAGGDVTLSSAAGPLIRAVLGTSAAFQPRSLPTGAEESSTVAMLQKLIEVGFLKRSAAVSK